MRIQGFTQFRDVAFDINGFDANGTSCTNDNAGLNGSSVCDDVILIPINSRQKVKFVKISANDTVLTLCEVQVFAGKPYNNFIVTVSPIWLFSLLACHTKRRCHCVRTSRRQ